MRFHKIQFQLLIAVIVLYESQSIKLQTDGGWVWNSHGARRVLPWKGKFSTLVHYQNPNQQIEARSRSISNGKFQKKAVKVQNSPSFSDIFDIKAIKHSKNNKVENHKRYSKAIPQQPLKGYIPSSLSSLLWKNPQFGTASFSRREEPLAFSSEDEDETYSKNILDVKSPDSPYGLIQVIFFIW